MSDLLPVFFVISFAILLAAILMGLSYILGKKTHVKRTHDVYESGVDPVGSATRRYGVKFYLTAILFLLFDIEVVFVFPWVIHYRSQFNSGPAYMFYGFLFFFLVLLVAYAFVILSKSLEWEK